MTLCAFFHWVGISEIELVDEEHHQELEKTILCARPRMDCLLCYTKIINASFSDTHPKMESLRIHLLRDMPAWRKLEMLAQLNAAAQLLALSGLRQRFPQASEVQLHRRLASLLLGEEKASEVYGERKDAS